MRKASIIICLCTMIAVSLTLWAQSNDLSPIMKQVGPTNTAINNGMKDRSMSASEVAKNADKLSDLFKQVSSFMKDHNIQDATQWAADASVAASDLSKAAKANDYDGMKAAYTKVSGACKTCHSVHREQLPDKTFKLKSR